MIRICTSFLLALLLIACSSEPEPIPEDSLPALVVVADDRCILIEKGQLRHEVRCTIEPAFTPMEIRIVDPVCGEYRFLRGGYTPLVCERGCNAGAAAYASCPLKHGSHSRVWAFYDQR